MIVITMRDTVQSGINIVPSTVYVAEGETFSADEHGNLNVHGSDGKRVAIAAAGAWAVAGKSERPIVDNPKTQDPDGYDPIWSTQYRLGRVMYDLYAAHGLTGLDAATSHAALLKAYDVSSVGRAVYQMRLDLAGMDAEQRAEKLRDSLGTDAIRAATILLNHAEQADGA